jgi:2-keto-4-pentenoate hydratase/2-oxohepta-3-ene-1,7-dioic acid hydratase in catechol pathway
VRLPDVSNRIDWELELAVVIGTRGFRISREEALDHVAGYTILNDVSAREMDWGLPERDDHKGDAFFDWLSGKWPDGFGPMGPWIVTTDEISDPQALDLRLTLNGELMQTGSTGEMIFGCAALIEFASRFMTLEPGDVITTGTIAGVGAAQNVFLEHGDIVEGTIGSIGTLRTHFIQDDVSGVDA